MAFLYPRTYLQEPKLLKDPAETPTWSLLPPAQKENLLGTSSVAPTIDNAAQAATQLLGTPVAPAAPTALAAPAAKGPPKFEEIKKKLEEQRRNENYYKVAVPRPKEEYERLAELARSLPEYQAGEKSTQQLEKLRDIYAANAPTPQVDLSPLYGLLATSFNRPEAGKFYKGPSKAAEQHQEQLIDLAKAAQKSRATQLSTLEDLMKQGTMGQQGITEQLLMKDLLERTQGTGKAHGPTENQQATNLREFTKLVRSDDEIKEIRKANSAMGEAATLLKQGGAISDQSFKGIWSRATGNAPISDADIRAVGIRPDISSKVKQIVENLATGTFIKATRDEYWQAFKALHDYRSGPMSHLLEGYRQTGIDMGIPEEKVDNAIGIFRPRAPVAPGNIAKEKKEAEKKETKDMSKDEKASKILERIKQLEAKKGQPGK